MPKRNLIWAVAIIAAAAAVMVVTRTPPPPPDDPDHVRFRPVIQAYRTICDHYYRPVKDGLLPQASVRGMVEQLDEYSSYIPPEKVRAFNDRLRGYVTGVGMLVDRADAGIEVIGALPGSPADAEGIGPGDRLEAVDDSPVEQLSAEEVRKLLSGPAGTDVKLALVDSSGRPRRCELTRRRFPVETVTGLFRRPDRKWNYLVDPEHEIGYVRIREFIWPGKRDESAPNTTASFRRALHELSEVRSIILDLRDNPGGHQEACCAVADMFLRSGVIYTTVDRRGVHVHRAHSGGTWRPKPTVVLIDGRTASAAEIVAGALRLHDRAVLVGTRTRGKGFVQSLIRLPGNLGQVNLTTAEFFVGTDRPISPRPDRDGWGVEPHCLVPLTPAQRRALRRSWMVAEVVPSAAPAPATVPATGPATAPASRPADRYLADDPQLAAAVALLRKEGAVGQVLLRAAAERRAREEKRRLERLRTAATQPGGNRDE